MGGKAREGRIQVVEEVETQVVCENLLKVIRGSYKYRCLLNTPTGTQSYQERNVTSVLRQNFNSD